MISLYAADRPTLPRDYAGPDRRREIIDAAALARRTDFLRRIGGAVVFVFVVAAVLKAAGVWL